MAAAEYEELVDRGAGAGVQGIKANNLQGDRAGAWPRVFAPEVNQQALSGSKISASGH